MTDGMAPDSAHLHGKVMAALQHAVALRDLLREIATVEPAYGSWWSDKGEEAATLAAQLEASQDRIQRWGKRRWIRS